MPPGVVASTWQTGGARTACTTRATVADHRGVAVRTACTTGTAMLLDEVATSARTTGAPVAAVAAG